jgi:hypothetical protein
MGDGAAARAVESHRADEALFVLVEDRDAAPPRRFWRVFAEVNRRMTMISAYDMAGEAHGEAALLSAAEAQLAALRRANARDAAPGAGSAAGPPRGRPAS